MSIKFSTSSSFSLFLSINESLTKLPLHFCFNITVNEDQAKGTMKQIENERYVDRKRKKKIMKNAANSFLMLRFLSYKCGLALPATLGQWFLPVMVRGTSRRAEDPS